MPFGEQPTCLKTALGFSKGLKVLSNSKILCDLVHVHTKKIIVEIILLNISANLKPRLEDSPSFTGTPPDQIVLLHTAAEKELKNLLFVWEVVFDFIGMLLN